MPRRGELAEFLLHAGDARGEGREHADLAAGIERGLEHRLVGFQDRDRARRRRLLDRLAKGRAGEQDAGGAGPRGVFGERRDAAGHRRRQFAVTLAVGAERGVEQVGALGRGPQPREGLMHQRIATVTAWIRAMRTTSKFLLTLKTE